MSTFLMFLTTLYTFVLSMTFSAFRCAPQDDGSYTLLPSPSLDCYDSIWYNHLGVIIVGILVISCVPVILFWILYRNRHNLWNIHFHWKYGGLTLPY
jgi:hypothetical protein